MTETVGDVIRDWRRNYRFISQSRAAELVGVHPSTLSLWESGGRNPTRPAVKRLLEVVDDAGLRMRIRTAANFAESDESFGSVFADIRHKYAVSTILLGARTGISRGIFYRWDNGETVPKKATLDRVCEVINPSPEDAERLYNAAGYRKNDMSDISEVEMDFLMNHIKTVQSMVTMVAPEAVSKLQAAMDRVDTLGPILDPTLYRDRMAVHGRNKECVDAFAAYHRCLMRIAEEEGL